MPRVLVVEDEPGIVLGLEDALRLEGYEVEVADNGLEAGRRASHDQFDLILLDVMLPGQNGFDVCRDLRRGGVETPVIPSGWNARLVPYRAAWRRSTRAR